MTPTEKIRDRKEKRKRANSEEVYGKRRVQRIRDNASQVSRECDSFQRMSQWGRVGFTP